jgi:serine/threonine protein kinase/Tol biopolymer transport system component
MNIGNRLGSYEIVSALGAGGMGEVYRAIDTKLKRQVAIKILPPLFASDPDRLARLQREAEVLAALNHPNIAAIYGLEEADGVKALVLELVEGEDLSMLLGRGPLPLDEVLPIAKQLCEALEAAHEAGIVHRDLKPANIKRRSDGTVKVLDFGLARPSSREATASAAGLQLLANSPTITSPVTLTAAGMVLGTAAYMAPEQVRGYVADRRADIWAFGVVLFEIITGRRLFDEPTISDTLASVLKSTPDWRALPESIPPQLHALLRWCLEKDPKRRLQAIGDARVQIERLIAGETDASSAKPKTATPRWQRVLPWAMAAAFAVATLVLLFGRGRSDEPASAIPVRVSALLGSGLSINAIPGTPVLTVSRDGSQIAFVAEKGSTPPPRIYVRRLDDLDATVVTGTEGAAAPFFSPDGSWIGFLAGGRLKKIPVTGGSAVDMAPAPGSRGAAWADDGSIVIALVRDGSLVRIPANGGTPIRVGALVEGEATQRWPQLLPGSGAVLFTGSRVPNAGYNEASLIVQALPTGQRKTILTGGFHGRYLPSGHIVYVQNGTLFARVFDLNRLEAAGPAVPVIGDVMSDTNTGVAQFAVSDTGTLVYLAGESATEGVDIQWLDRDGKASPLRTTHANWWNLRFAPDRRRLALQITEGTDDIWIYEWSRDVLTRVTGNAGDNTLPVWTPDGRRLVFASTRESKAPNLYWQRADETGGAARLTSSANAQRPGSWDPTGRFLVYEELDAQSKLNVMMLFMEGDESSGWKAGNATAVLNGIANEYQPAVSPDGRWLAYVSDESGRDQVYVRPFRRAGGRMQVSVAGGRTPVWSPTSAEILYGVMESNQGQIMIARYSVKGDEFIADKPRPWLGQRYQGRGPNRMFDIHPDGTRVALGPVIGRENRPHHDHVTMIFNLFDMLHRIVKP